MKATDYFKRNCKLIDTVNKNYSHICELEELHRAFDAAGGYWVSEVGIEYDLLSKIAWETKWNHYKSPEEKSPWDVKNILKKLETTDELSDILPREQLNKYPGVKISKYVGS